jgi:hypothetical protein
MIEEVFKELERSGLVDSGADFSRDWLGMEESYWRCLKFKGRQPSAKALANCAARLRRKAQLLERSSLPEAKTVAQRMDLLSSSCVEKLLAGSGG